MITKTINTNTTSNTQDDMSLQEKSAYSTALLRSLQFSGVKFLRYFTIDLCNNIRCKVKPIDHLLRAGDVSLEHQVSIAEVCYGGLPFYADLMIEGTGMTARNVLRIEPDLSSFRNLPYAKKSAVVMGNLIDQYSNEPSPLCTRSLLRKVIQEAKEKHNIAFVSIMHLYFIVL
jgi:glutamine synthetase